jgi:quinol monooxygenase YgiN
MVLWILICKESQVCLFFEIYAGSDDVFASKSAPTFARYYTVGESLLAKLLLISINGD